MTTHRLLNRRVAIAEMGRAGLAVVVFGTAACSDPAGTGAIEVGSVDAVMEQAPGAILYALAPDIPEIASVMVPRPVGDGDRVFDLEIIESPGHTPGHICVLHGAAGVPVAGDAMVGADGAVGGPDPSVTEDMSVALDSVRKLAGFSYEIALFGHGEPVLEGASTAVSVLAEG